MRHGGMVDMYRDFFDDSVPVASNEDPFPHWIVDHLWDDQLLDEVVGEFPNPDDGRWQRYQNALEEKLALGPSGWGPATTQLAESLSDPAWIGYLESLTGITGLIPEFVGGGFHRIENGGMLGIHVDFNISPETGRYRRLNCLIYLNRDWHDEYGGHLELWSSGESPEISVKILPSFNRTAIFETSDSSFHGHPHPLKCPNGRARMSFAVYYYTELPPDNVSAAHSTIFLNE